MGKDEDEDEDEDVKGLDEFEYLDTRGLVTNLGECKEVGGCVCDILHVILAAMKPNEL